MFRQSARQSAQTFEAAVPYDFLSCSSRSKDFYYSDLMKADFFSAFQHTSPPPLFQESHVPKRGQKGELQDFAKKSLEKPYNAGFWRVCGLGRYILPASSLTRLRGCAT